MKKFISTISILSIMIFTNSCRSQDESLETEISDDYQSNTNIFKRESDSLKTDSTKILKLLPGDPPPKNGHQW